MPHFTCVAPPSSSCATRSTRCASFKLENVLALRGDPPAGQEEWIKTPGGLEYSAELVSLIRGSYPELAIGSACFRRRTSRHLARGRPPLPQGEGRRGREVPHHPALPRQPLLPRLRGTGGDIGIEVPIVPASCHHQQRADQEDHPAVRQRHPAADPRRAAGPRGRSRRRGGLRRGLRDAAVRRPAGRRAPGIHFYTLNRSRRRAPSSARSSSHGRGTGRRASRRSRLGPACGKPSSAARTSSAGPWTQRPDSTSSPSRVRPRRAWSRPRAHRRGARPRRRAAARARRVEERVASVEQLAQVGVRAARAARESTIVT